MTGRGSGRIDVQIFLSSPGDVAAERDFAATFIEQELAKRAAFRDTVNLRLERWDDPAARIPLVANLSPQDAVNRGMPPPAQCDIVIGILWTRMGTPLAEPLKPDGRKYMSGTEWEIENALAPESRAATVLLYHRQDQPPAPHGKDALKKFGIQRDLVQKFVERIRRPNPRSRRGVERYTGFDAFKLLLAQHLDGEIWRIVRERSPTAPTREMEAPRYLGAPYVGLRSYEPEQAEIFCGRDVHIDRLASWLVDANLVRPFIAVAGVSGSGKSSLVKAGLVPRMARAEWPWAILRLNRADPIETIADKLAAITPPGQRRDAADLASDWRDDPSKIAASVTPILADRPASARLIVVIDQFEELATAIRDVGRRREVLDLLEALRAVDRARVVVTVRTDLVADLVSESTTAGDERLAAWLSGCCYILDLPGPISLRAIVEEPARRAGLRVDPDLAEALVSKAFGNLGALSLLSFTLQRLFERRGDATVLRGDAEGEEHLIAALRSHVADVEAGVRPEILAAAPELFGRLVGVSERDARLVKLRVDATSLSEAAVELAEVLASDRSRLLTWSSEQGRFVELAHEVLLTAWPRLADWVRLRRVHIVARDELERLQARWSAADRPDALLAPFWLVSEALKALDDVPALFSPSQREYIEASRAARDAFWVREAQSIAERAKAKNEAGDPVTAALLALEALPDPTREPSRPIVAECFSELYAAARMMRKVGVFEAEDSRINSVAFSPDGTRLATGSDDRTARLWDLATGAQIARLDGHERGVSSVAFSPDGTRLATVPQPSGMPPDLRNHLDPTGIDTPTSAAASSLDRPAAIAAQNPTRSSRIATGGRPGDDSFFRPARAERLFPAIATSISWVLRRPVETAKIISIGMRQWAHG